LPAIALSPLRYHIGSVEEIISTAFDSPVDVPALHLLGRLLFLKQLELTLDAVSFVHAAAGMGGMRYAAFRLAAMFPQRLHSLSATMSLCREYDAVA